MTTVQSTTGVRNGVDTATPFVEQSRSRSAVFDVLNGVPVSIEVNAG